MMLSILLLVSPLVVDKSADACQQEITQIDAQVEKLEKARDIHADRAAQFQDEGDRWQFRSGQIEDARRAWSKADDERRQAQDFQMQIEHLQAKKARILEYYPQLRQ